MAEELREILSPRDKFSILGEGKTKAGGSTLNILVPWAQADEKTINGRIYSKSLLHREVDRIQKAVTAGALIGTGDHPASGLADVATASHIVKKLWLDGEGRGWAQIKILDTERGKNIQSIIKAGGQLGISTRGFGNTAKDGRVLDDYRMLGIDVVMNPSVSSATFSKENIFESVGFEEEKKVEPVKETKVKINERAAENALKLGYKVRVEECFYEGSYEEFANQNRGIVTAELLQQDYPDKFSTIEEALEYLGIPELLEKHREASKEERVLEYTIEEVYDEARIAGINPKEMCDKLNENLKVTTVLNNAGITEKERSLMNELRSAGAIGTAMELLEKVRKVEAMQKIFKPNLSEAQQIIEDEKKAKELKEAKRSRIIAQINRDIANAGGTSQEKLKEMVSKALKAEGLDSDE